MFGGMGYEPPLPGSVVLLVLFGNTDSVKKKGLLEAVILGKRRD